MYFVLTDNRWLKTTVGGSKQTDSSLWQKAVLGQHPLTLSLRSKLLIISWYLDTKFPWLSSLPLPLFFHPPLHCQSWSILPLNAAETFWWWSLGVCTDALGSQGSLVFSLFTWTQRGTQLGCVGRIHVDCKIVLCLRPWLLSESVCFSSACVLGRPFTGVRLF